MLLWCESRLLPGILGKFFCPLPTPEWKYNSLPSKRKAKLVNLNRTCCHVLGGKQYNNNLVSTITIRHLTIFTESSLCLAEICIWEMDTDALQLLAEKQTGSPSRGPGPCLKHKEKTPWEENGMKIPPLAAGLNVPIISWLKVTQHSSLIWKEDTAFKVWLLPVTE